MKKLLPLLLLTLLPATASAYEIERNFAGSAQLDYLAVPTSVNGRNFTFDGFTTELAVKLAVDFTENFSANVKICYGCHGFETDMAYVDMRVADQLNFRVGRMNPAFGDFLLRHDPANHRANSKPLPYDMGRMLRRNEWNMSIVPAPYVDNGLEVNGTQWFGDDAQLDYAGYVVSGFKGNNDAFDFDFVQSRSGSLYYVDNNSEPAVGGRAALTLNFTDYVNGTFGLSGMYGHYDPAADLEYLILGADVYLRFDALVIRGEYLFRKTEFAVGSNPDERFRYEFDPKKNFFTKDGFYVEAEYPITDYLELFGRLDGMRRKGNVLASSALRSTSAILRETLGVNIVVQRGLRIKLSGEYWDFSDFANEVAVHAGVTANF
ncbi:MAG: hypothetical protein RIT81_30660 [Deltaproteobacteria bacterium]